MDLEQQVIANLRELVDAKENGLAGTTQGGSLNSTGIVRLNVSFQGKNTLPVTFGTGCHLPTKVICLLMEDGKWLALGEAKSEVSKRTVIKERRWKEVDDLPQKLYPFKVLFQVGDKFYVGGDRAKPDLVCVLPVGFVLIGANITNIGKKPKDWIVGITYSVANNAYNRNIYGPDTNDVDKNWIITTAGFDYSPYLWRQWGFWTYGSGAPSSLIFSQHQGVNFGPSPFVQTSQFIDLNDQSASLPGASLEVYQAPGTGGDSSSTPANTSAYQIYDMRNYEVDFSNYMQLATLVLPPKITQTWHTTTVFPLQPHRYFLAGQSFYNGFYFDGFIRSGQASRMLSGPFYNVPATNFAVGQVDAIQEGHSIVSSFFGPINDSAGGEKQDGTATNQYIWKFENRTEQLQGTMAFSLANLIVNREFRDNTATGLHVIQRYSVTHVAEDSKGRTVILPGVVTSVKEDAQTLYGYSSALYGDGSGYYSDNINITGAQADREIKLETEINTQLTTKNLKYALATNKYFKIARRGGSVSYGLSAPDENIEIYEVVCWIYDDLGNKFKVIDPNQGTPTAYSPGSICDTLIPKQNDFEIVRLFPPDLDPAKTQNYKISPSVWKLNKNGSVYDLVEQTLVKQETIKALNRGVPGSITIHSTSYYPV